MTLHVFNPEHDIVLAADLANFTAPHAGRQLRTDLGFLPAIWAGDDDAVLVDNVEQTERVWRRFSVRTSSLRVIGKSRFLSWKSATSLSSVTRIEPWGWDKALCAALKRRGVDEQLLPTAAQLENIRQLSHRRMAAQLLSRLQREGTVGEAFECRIADEVTTLLERYGQMVVKAPWSSSGRGVRFLDNKQVTVNNSLWLHNIITAQGSVMVEPYYNKVKDFGMEFEALADGTVTYLGLSLFHTKNGAYTGNIIATESAKRELISRYIAMSLLDDVREEICCGLAEIFKGRYVGPLGVDMMIVRGGLLHPCVEINLRRTMGHAALALTPRDDVRRVMRIDYNGTNYKLRINKLSSNKLL